MSVYGVGRWGIIKRGVKSGTRQARGSSTVEGGTEGAGEGMRRACTHVSCLAHRASTGEGRRTHGVAHTRQTGLGLGQGGVAAPIDARTAEQSGTAGWTGTGLGSGLGTGLCWNWEGGGVLGMWGCGGLRGKRR